MACKICFIILLLFNFSNQLHSDDYDFIYMDGIRELSELPMQKLLKIRSSFVPRLGKLKIKNKNYQFDQLLIKSVKFI